MNASACQLWLIKMEIIASELYQWEAMAKYSRWAIKYNNGELTVDVYGAHLKLRHLKIYNNER
jgi:hypothetical protein